MSAAGRQGNVQIGVGARAAAVSLEAPAGPVLLNLPFREPLVDADSETLAFDLGAAEVRRAHPLYASIALGLLTEVINSRLFTTVRDTLGDDRTYTTISTLVRILEQKGFLIARKVGKQHLYSPTTPREAYARGAVRDLVERLFGGHPGALVRTLVDAAPPSEDELAELRALLQEKP